MMNDKTLDLFLNLIWSREWESPQRFKLERCQRLFLPIFTGLPAHPTGHDWVVNILIIKPWSNSWLKVTSKFGTQKTTSIYVLNRNHSPRLVYANHLSDKIDNTECLPEAPHLSFRSQTVLEGSFCCQDISYVSAFLKRVGAAAPLAADVTSAPRTIRQVWGLVGKSPLTHSPAASSLRPLLQFVQLSHQHSRPRFLPSTS